MVDCTGSYRTNPENVIYAWLDFQTFKSALEIEGFFDDVFRVESVLGRLFLPCFSGTIQGIFS